RHTRFSRDWSSDVCSSDLDDVTAAIRETREEVGLVVRPEDVVGRLSDHPSPAGYVATPLVAVLDWPQALETDPNEVAETFTVPRSEERRVGKEGRERR